MRAPTACSPAIAISSARRMAPSTKNRHGGPVAVSKMFSQGPAPPGEGARASPQARTGPWPARRPGGLGLDGPGRAYHPEESATFAAHAGGRSPPIQRRLAGSTPGRGPAGLGTDLRALGVPRTASAPTPANREPDAARTNQHLARAVSRPGSGSAKLEWAWQSHHLYASNLNGPGGPGAPRWPAPSAAAGRRPPGGPPGCATPLHRVARWPAVAAPPPG